PPTLMVEPVPLKGERAYNNEVLRDEGEPKTRDEQRWAFIEGYARRHGLDMDVWDEKRLACEGAGRERPDLFGEYLRTGDSPYAEARRTEFIQKFGEGALFGNAYKKPAKAVDINYALATVAAEHNLDVGVAQRGLSPEQRDARVKALHLMARDSRFSHLATQG